MVVAEERRNLVIGLNKFFLSELRRVLWKHRLSAQEFVSYVIMLLATGDQRIHDIMLEAKKAKTQKVTVNTVHTDEESLYNLIERTLSEGKVDGRR
jgi:hypothetical protein